jgi:hypothetical protein
LIVAPVRAGRQLFEDFAEKWMQESASLMSGHHQPLREFSTSRAMSSRLVAQSDFTYVVGCNSLAGRRGSARTGGKSVAIYAASSAAADVGDEPAAATRIFLTRTRE